MSSRKKRGKKKKKFRRHIQQDNQSTIHPYVYQRMPPVFEGVSRSEIINFFKKIGEENEAKYNESFRTLQSRLFTVNPLQLLSMFAFYDLIDFVGEKKSKKYEKIPQGFIEVIQALVLQSSYDKFAEKPIMPEDFTKIRDLLCDTANSFKMRRFVKVEDSISLEQRHRLMLLEFIRGQTQAVRNWGYPQHITGIVREIFTPLDEDIEQQIGIRVNYLVTMGLDIMSLVEKKIMDHFVKISPMGRAKTVDAAIRNYMNLFPDLTPEKIKDLTESLKSQGVTLEMAKAMCISHSDLWLPEVFIITLNDFMSAYPRDIDPEKLSAILDQWSFSFGDLATYNSEHFFLNNPIWHRPFIKVDKDKYFCPLMNLFLSFCIELMEDLIVDHPYLCRAYERCRSQFLVEKTIDLLRTALPSADVYKGNKWTDSSDGKDYENDILVVVDTHAIIIEAKSGRVPDPARRGAELSLKRVIEELVVEPSKQSQRFVNFLQENRGTISLKTQHGVIAIDMSKIQEYIRLNVILDNIGELHARWPELVSGGFISEKFELASTIHLADLQIIFEILEGQCEKLHYLKRRLQFEKNLNYLADEIDLLAFYLDTGFNIGESEFSGSSLIIYGLSTVLDPFFMQKYTGQKVQKPCRRLTPWWKDLLNKVEERQFTRWTEIGCTLLNVAFSDQTKFEQVFKKIQQKVKYHWKQPGDINSVVLSNGPPQRKDTIVGFAYKMDSLEKRNALITDIAIKAMNKHGTTRSLVIGKDVTQNDYPYSVMALIGAPPRDESNSINSAL